jgi:hypothetical protein
MTRTEETSERGIRDAAFAAQTNVDGIPRIEAFDSTRTNRMRL